MRTLEARAISAVLGTEILGVDLREPIDESLEDAMRDALDRNSLLLFRDQQIEPADHVRAATVFGKVSRQGAAARAGAGDVSFISNAHPEGRAGSGELLFHSDQASWENPQRVLTLYGVQIPASGGETLYSSMLRAYEVLPPALKTRIANLHSVNKFDYAAYFAGKPLNVRAPIKDAGGDQVSAIHPVALPHPRTGKTVLYLSEPHAHRIVELGEDESDRLLSELFSYIRHADNIYRHTWRVGDLIIWDNMALLHARTPWDPAEARTLRRIQVS